MKPSIGTTVRDEGSRRVGKVMGHEGPYVQLRPLNGGREWDAVPENCKSISRSEALSGAVAEVNALSSRSVK
ncbi:hypothetical protein OHA11_38865 [Streptomyces sp. NBC_00878]|nr:hypothetical protein [Streptomyces sp. NBC_00878]